MSGRSTWVIPAVFLALASLSLLAAPAPGKGKAAKKKKAGLLIAHTVKEIGLTVKFNSDWLVEKEITKKGGNVYQHVADTDGLVFVRYGKNYYDQEETIDTLKAVLADMLRTVTVKSDKKIKFCGKSARRAVLLQKKKAVRVYLEDEKGQIVDKEEPEETTVVVAIGFRVKGIPVLVGYRMPEQHLAAWKAVLEEIISSVSLSKPETTHASTAAYPGAVVSCTDAATGTSFEVAPDGRTLLAKNADGKETLRVDVIETCGSPAVGEPVIRHLAVAGSSLEITFGKHAFASLDIKTMTLACQGSD